MFYALGAGKLFDPTKKSEYIDTLISKCIDEYIKLKKEQAESKSPSEIKLDERLERIVLGMFDRCYSDKQFKQALGIAVESRRLDKIEESIRKSDDVPSMLVYCQNLCSDVVTNRDFRHTVNIKFQYSTF
jgi:26S proteasome regulatory subunit N2